jgi:hypothetical protein
VTNEQHLQFCEAVIGAHIFFGDVKKVSAWLRMDNLNFGGCSPMRMIQLNKGKKLNDWINTQLDENKPLSTARNFKLKQKSEGGEGG